MAVIDVKAEVLNDEKQGSRAAAAGGLMEWLLALPRLIVLAIRLLLDSRVPAANKAMLAGGLLYIVSPIDLVPDMIPVLGQLEDMALAVVLVNMMVNQVDASIVSKYWGGKAATLKQIGRITAGILKVLPGFLQRRVMRKTLMRRPGQTAQA